MLRVRARAQFGAANPYRPGRSRVNSGALAAKFTAMVARPASSSACSAMVVRSDGPLASITMLSPSSAPCREMVHRRLCRAILAMLFTAAPAEVAALAILSLVFIG